MAISRKFTGENTAGQTTDTAKGEFQTSAELEAAAAKPKTAPKVTAPEAAVATNEPAPAPPPTVTQPPPEAPPTPPPVAKARAARSQRGNADDQAPEIRSTARPGEKGFKPFQGVRFAPAFRPGRASTGPDFIGEGKVGRADTRATFTPGSALGSRLQEENEREQRADAVVTRLGS